VKRLSETVRERTEIQSAVLQQYFAGCSLDAARELLLDSGFEAGETDPRSNNNERKRGTRRLVVAEKNLRPFGFHGSLNCRIILRIEQSNELSTQGFFYLDGP